uniref:5-hydroxytryptamine receptor 3E-like n=1 Tax=Canis lupus dingo TaxID=286419 RepID=A0A8C0JPS4_CANLU
TPPPIPSPPTSLLLTHSISTTGKGSTFIINCSGFGQHGVYPTVLDSAFDRKAFRPVTNFSIPTLVNISFTMSAILDVVSVWDNPFIRWNPEECEGITKISVATKNLWLPDIFIVELFDRQLYPWEMTWISLSVENMLLGMEKEVWEIADTSRDIVQTHGEWELLGINKATPKMSLGTSLYDQIMFYVAIRRRPRLYIINLLVPSGFLIAIDALSFYLPAESGNRAPFKITLLLGYKVFLLMMNDLLPTSEVLSWCLWTTCRPTFPPGVYFALCLSLMVVSLLETIFITYLLHLATTQPPPMPRWLHSLLLYWANPRTCCPTAPQKINKGIGLPPAHLPGVKEPVELVRKVSGPREAELNGCPESTRAQQEDEAQRQHLVNLWVQFSHMMDTLLFRLYLLFMATSVVTVIVLWNI